MGNPTNATVAAGLAARRDNFLLLRILAAVLVVYGHSHILVHDGDHIDAFRAAGWGIYSGDVGVNLFFVVSGFMVGGSYLRRHDLWAFASARLRRIVPAYLVVLVVAAFVIGPIVSAWSYHDYMAGSMPYDYVRHNAFFPADLYYLLPAVFDGNPEHAVNGSLWTLPAEMSMYVLVALLGATWVLRSKWLTSTVLAALLLILAINPALLPISQQWTRPVCFFIVGILVQIHKDHIPISHETMAALTLVAYLTAGTLAHPIIIGTAICYFAFWFAYALPVVDVERFGDPSYGCYLWAFPIQQILVKYMPSIDPWPMFWLSMVLSLAVGYASWHLLEKPIVKWKPRSRRGQTFAREAQRRLGG